MILYYIDISSDKLDKNFSPLTTPKEINAQQDLTLQIQHGKPSIS